MRFQTVIPFPKILPSPKINKMVDRLFRRNAGAHTVAYCSLPFLLRKQQEKLTVIKYKTIKKQVLKITCTSYNL